MINKSISILYRYGLIHLRKRFRPLGIAGGQVPVLLWILKNPGVTQEKISKELAIDKGTTARAVSKLLKDGFIEKTADGTDRRLFRLCATEKAAEAAACIRRELDLWYEILFRGFSDEEKEKLDVYLQRMMQNAREHVEIP